MSEEIEAQSKIEDRPNQTDTNQSFNDHSSDQDQDSSSLIGLEIDPEALFEQWSKEDAWVEEQAQIRERERFSIGRQPLALVAIAIVSIFLAIYTFPALDAVLHEGEYEECGNLLDRKLAQNRGGNVEAFQHQQSCHLTAMVGTPNIFAIGKQDNAKAQDEFERNRGISYVVKLNGDQVYAILPAHPRKIEGYRLKNGSLFGLEIDEKGLMIAPTTATSYRHLERELRVNLGVSPNEKLWFFDVTYSPWDHKMPLATALLTPLIALLAILALKRELARRQIEKMQSKSEQEWLEAFEMAAQDAGLETSKIPKSHQQAEQES